MLRYRAAAPTPAGIIMCAGGNYALPGRSECTFKPLYGFWYSADAITCIHGYIPASGTSSQAGNLQCVACPSGTFSSPGDFVCTPCPSSARGTTISRNTGSAACEECPAGTTASVAKDDCNCKDATCVKRFGGVLTVCECSWPKATGGLLTLNSHAVWCRRQWQWPDCGSGSGRLCSDLW
jgi:hypothetical protein